VREKNPAFLEEASEEYPPRKPSPRPKIKEKSFSPPGGPHSRKNPRAPWDFEEIGAFYPPTYGGDFGGEQKTAGETFFKGGILGKILGGKFFRNLNPGKWVRLPVE